MWSPIHFFLGCCAFESSGSSERDLYSSFLIMKRLRVFLFPLEGMQDPRRVALSIKFAGAYLYICVKWGTVRVKCLANSQTRLQPGLLDQEFSALTVRWLCHSHHTFLTAWNLLNFCLCFLFSADELVKMRKDKLTPLQILNITDDLGKCWHSLGIKLNIQPVSKVDNLEEDYRFVKERARKVLSMWIEQYGKDATVGRLASALIAINQRGIAEKLLGAEVVLLLLWYNYNELGDHTEGYPVITKIGSYNNYYYINADMETIRFTRVLMFHSALNRGRYRSFELFGVFRYIYALTW